LRFDKDFLLLGCMILAAVEIDFLGQPGFPWWGAVDFAAAIALGWAAWRAQRTHEKSAVAVGQKITLTPAMLFGGATGIIGLITVLLLTLDATFAPVVSFFWTLAVLLVATLLLYRRVFALLSHPRFGALLALRIAALVLIVLLLFEPVLGFIADPRDRPVVAVVVDASQSMGVVDQTNQPTRYRQSVLGTQALAARLAGQYHVVALAYDDSHRAALPDVETLDTISPTGQVTDLSAALGLGASVNPADIVLLSDGIDNGSADLDGSLKHITVPVHTVRVGSDALEPSTIPDIAVAAVDAPSTATVNTQVTIDAQIQSTALSDRTVKVQLFNGDTMVDEQRLVLRSGPTPQGVKLKFLPTVVGRASLRVAVPPDPDERSQANNQRDVPLLVTDPKLAVLYIEGRVRPEVGPLRRALEQDPNVAAVSMVQTVAGRFDLRGVKAGDDLRGLPISKAQWGRFKVVILGDVDSQLLSAEQQGELADWVRAGGGLMMIGGQRSFAPGGWGATPIAAVLPVDLGPLNPAQINAPFVPKLTAFGAANPILANITQYFVQADGSAGKDQLPALSGCVALGDAKAGATVLLVHPAAQVHDQPAIVLAAEQVGKGRSLAFAADTTWRWSLFLRAAGRDSPYFRFWGQSVRWLAGQSDLKRATAASVVAMLPRDRFVPGDSVPLRAEVTDTDGQSTAYANVQAVVTGPDGKSQTVALAAVENDLGLYGGAMKPHAAGTYSVKFTASKDGKSLGNDTTTFAVTPPASEMETLAARPATLQEIAQQTGGTYSEIGGIDALADRLIAALPPRDVAQRKTVALYSPRWFFGLFVLTLTAEWLLRRRWSLQ
jgi:uncharacterized membrane protein